jgi:hypothetical protein
MPVGTASKGLKTRIMSITRMLSGFGRLVLVSMHEKVLTKGFSVGETHSCAAQFSVVKFAVFSLFQKLGLGLLFSNIGPFKLTRNKKMKGGEFSPQWLAYNIKTDGYYNHTYQDTTVIELCHSPIYFLAILGG